MHFGIKGQKWGVRRYQNPDGTLTEEGKRRYRNADGSLNEEGKKFFKKRYENYDGTINEEGRKVLKGKMEKLAKSTEDYENYKSDPQFRDLKASHFLAKDMLKFIDGHTEIKVSEIEEAYDKNFSKRFDVYLPYLKEQRRKGGRVIYDII